MLCLFSKFTLQLFLSCYLHYVCVQQELKQGFFSVLDIHLPLSVPDLSGEQALFDCPSADLALSISCKWLWILPFPRSRTPPGSQASPHRVGRRHSPRFPHGSRPRAGLPAHPEPGHKAGETLGIHNHLCCLGTCPCCLFSCQVLSILSALSRPSRFLHPAQANIPAKLGRD